jgi:V-type H+-transporting ATPase subunit a
MHGHKNNTKDIIRHTKQVFREYLEMSNNKENADVSVFKVYKVFILKEKSIYTCLNMLKQQNMIFQGLVWCPKSLQFERKINALINQTNLTGFTYEKAPDDYEGLVRPTLFMTNEVLWPFQEIVNTYGAPRYKEANPALFTVVSFPFLFGVMFGDIMHGLWLTCYSVYLCFANRSNPNTIAGQVGHLRYLFLLMGIFSTYCGLIYNDFSSLGTELMGKSCFNKIEHGKSANYAHRTDTDCVYPFGMDPIWFRSTQEIAYMNSFKMKISVILGVSQMLMGTTLKGFNAIYFRRWVELIFDVFS